MADYSSSDINEAKKRVDEMRRRARSIMDDSQPELATADDGHKARDNSISPSPIGSLLSSFLGSGEDSSSALILALVLILSREKADNMLILALLYILL